jgi:hypothetical protein
MNSRPDLRLDVTRLDPWILWVSALATLNTVVHHLHGARIYDTPGRYHAMWLALGGIALQVVALAIAQHADSRVARVARMAFYTVTALFFVVLFGVVEGLVTHVVFPIVRRGYGTEEPFELLFQTTGILHVGSAVAAALLVASAVSAGRRTHAAK